MTAQHLAPELDDDGQPIEPGEKYETDQDRSAGWQVANRSPKTITRAPVCPECRTGKHGNCDGTAFDEAADDIVECVCPPAFGHRERNPR